jgi:hypothetical protein
MPKTQQSTSYQLLNFNIPRRLKTSLDAVVDYKRISRTSIINSLLDEYVRNEISNIKEDGHLTSLIASAIKKVNNPQSPPPPMVEKNSTRSNKWESSYS